MKGEGEGGKKEGKRRHQDKESKKSKLGCVAMRVGMPSESSTTLKRGPGRVFDPHKIQPGRLFVRGFSC